MCLFSLLIRLCYNTLDWKNCTHFCADGYLLGCVGDNRMDEGRKRVLLIAAAILAARKLVNWDGKPSPALENAINDAIGLAERILSRIDARWPLKEQTRRMS